MTQARLIPTRTPRNPEGVVLVLHGGAGRGNDPVSARQPSVVRMIPIAARIAVAGRGRLAVYRLLNSTRGWSEHHTPVDDVRWALDQVAGEDLALPAALVGHSLGGRAALLSAGDPRVRSVVALAPWVYATDGDASVKAREILFVHGDADRIASLERSRAVARTLAENNDVEFVTVAGGNHAMLSRNPRNAPFTRLAAAFTARTMLRSAPEPADEQE